MKKNTYWARDTHLEPHYRPLSPAAAVAAAAAVVPLSLSHPHRTMGGGRHRS